LRQGGKDAAGWQWRNRNFVAGAFREELKKYNSVNKTNKAWDLPQVAETHSPQPMDAAGESPLYDGFVVRVSHAHMADSRISPSTQESWPDPKYVDVWQQMGCLRMGYLQQ
jgi:hypothetical protein